MSRTTVYQIAANGEVHEVGEASNAWGSAPLIWKVLAKKYGVHDPLDWGDRPKEEPMWALHKTHALSYIDRVALLFSFDSAVVAKKNVPALSAALRAFYNEHGGDCAPTLLEVADLLDGLGDDAIGACFQMTSVSENVWRVRDMGDDEECRAYQFGKDHLTVVGGEPFEIFGDDAALPAKPGGVK